MVSNMGFARSGSDLCYLHDKVYIFGQAHQVNFMYLEMYLDM